MIAFGFRNVEDVPLAPDEPLTLGRILQHLEFMARMDEPTRVRPYVPQERDREEE